MRGLCSLPGLDCGLEFGLLALALVSLGPKRCMTATTVNRALERMGYAGKFSGHGFRSTASTLLHELGWRSEVIERQLAHAERDKVKAAYNHAEYMPERRDMMQTWADWIDALAAKAAAEGKETATA